jgi:hypothetical protein
MLSIELAHPASLAIDAQMPPTTRSCNGGIIIATGTDRKVIEPRNTAGFSARGIDARIDR